jgi:hypothetical protein
MKRSEETYAFSYLERQHLAPVEERYSRQMHRGIGQIRKPV